MNAVNTTLVVCPVNQQRFFIEPGEVRSQGFPFLLLDIQEVCGRSSISLSTDEMVEKQTTKLSEGSYRAKR
jgi:hypothetical protein